MDAERPQHRVGRNRVAFAAAVVTLILTGIATLVVQRIADRQTHASLELQATAVAESIQAGLDDLEHHVDAVAGLFQTDENVTADEYATFVSHSMVEDGHLVSGIGRISYARIVNSSDLADFEEQMASITPGYHAFESTADGDRIPVQPRDTYYLVQYSEPAAEAVPLGLDVGSLPNRMPYILEAVSTGMTATSPLGPLPIGPEGFVVYKPVLEDETAVALVAAPVVLDDLVADSVAESRLEVLTWTIRDITKTGRQPTGDSFTHAKTLVLPSQLWQLNVTPTPDSPLLAGRGDAYSVIVIGVLLSSATAVVASRVWRGILAEDELADIREIVAAKDTFIATVSHELRTPLTAVLGFTEILRNPNLALPDSEQRDLLTAIAQQAGDLSNIVEDLLVTARASHGVLGLKMMPVDLANEAESVLAAFDVRRAVVTISTGEVPVLALGDPGRVRQIIRNLVSNALSHGGDEIGITVSSDNDTAALTVSDNGEGIDPEHGDRIFEPYYRSHIPPGKPGSMGLGLSVSRTLARLMDGDVTLDRSDGRTCFRLTLPRGGPT